MTVIPVLTPLLAAADKQISAGTDSGSRLCVQVRQRRGVGNLCRLRRPKLVRPEQFLNACCA